MSQRTVALGTLEKDTPFWFSGRRYIVRKNLGQAGVTVRPQARDKVEVVVGERTFLATPKSTSEVWSAASPVIIEVPDRESQ